MTGDSSMTFSKRKVKELIEDCGGEFVGVIKNKEVYLLKDESIVRINTNNRRISFDELEEIALEQLEVGTWDFDYWVGENS